MSTEATSLIGRRFGVYQIEERLGAGGMGVVYRARDTRLGRNVAIKVLPAAFITDVDRLSRFEREARLLAAVNHPNIAAVYGVEDSDGIRGLVMELVEGNTLAEKLAGSGADRLSIVEAVTVARQIADALDAAHERGIVHRDLKPANISVTPNGTVKVLDFGLAKSTTGGVSRADLSHAATETVAGTLEGMVLGTAAYMSPEQARGKAVDKRADIWAFGCVLFELLAGRPAFLGETSSDTIANVLGREPDWTALPPETPPSLVRLLRRCLDRVVRRRLHDIADARIEIEDVLSEERTDHTHSRHSAGFDVRTWRAAAIAAIGGLLALTALLFLRDRLPAASLPEWSAADLLATQLTNYGGTESAAAMAPNGRSFAFSSEHDGTPDLWVRQVSGGEPVRLTKDAAQETDLVYSPDGESLYFTRIDGPDRSIWRIGALGGTPLRAFANAQAPAPSPDGRSLAYFAPEDGGTLVLTIAALDGSTTRALTSVSSGSGPLRWSPNGRSISYGQTGIFAPRNLFIADVATGDVRQATRFTNAQEGIVSHAWLPDNRHLAVTFVPPQAVGVQDLGILSLEDASLSRLTYNVVDAFGEISATADGTRLMVTSLRHQHSMWKVPLGPDPDQNGQRAVRMLDDRYEPNFPVVSRDGFFLVFNGGTTGSRNVWMGPIDASTPPRQITTILGNAVQHVSLSPDGTRVAFGSRASGNNDIWTQNVDGSNLRQLTDDAPPDSWPVWSPDGHSIVFNTLRDGRSETWRIPADGGAAEKIDDGSFRGDWIQQPSGEGTWLASWKESGRIRLRDVERNTTVWEQPLGRGSNTLPMFSSNGRLMSVAAPVGDREVIWILDAASGRQLRTAVRFPAGFSTEFRANWVDKDQALVVIRADNVRHIVLFDRFRVGANQPAR